MEKLKSGSQIKKRGKRTGDLLVEVYDALLAAFGAQHWWPGETSEEVIIGAVLTQNTNWSNVEKAIHVLREHNALSLRTIAEMEVSFLASLIKPAGYFNIKAKRLKSVASFFSQYSIRNLSMRSMTHIEEVRNLLLGVNGIGKETADSILLYAFNASVFVIDAYTRRFLVRHGLLDSTSVEYDSIRSIFESNLPCSVTLFNEYHALFVRLGKTFCRSKPLCDNCPLYSDRFYSNSKVSIKGKRRYVPQRS